MEKLQVQEEKTQLHYKIGSTRVRQKVGAEVSLMVGYREGTGSAKQESDRLYLANWEQFWSAKELIARYCPKAEALWSEK